MTLAKKPDILLGINRNSSHSLFSFTRSLSFPSLIRLSFRLDGGSSFDHDFGIQFKWTRTRTHRRAPAWHVCKFSITTPLCKRVIQSSIHQPIIIRCKSAAYYNSREAVPGETYYGAVELTCRRVGIDVVLRCFYLPLPLCKHFWYSIRWISVYFLKVSFSVSCGFYFLFKFPESFYSSSALLLNLEPRFYV